MSNILFNDVLNTILAGDLPLDELTLKLMLITDAYVPNADDDFTTISAEEVVEVNSPDNGYTAGGETVTVLSIVNGELLANHVSWADATFSCRYALLYDATTPASEIPIALFDLGGVRTVSANVFQILWGAAGGGSGVVLRLSQN